MESPLGDFSNLNKHFFNKPLDHPVCKAWHGLNKKRESNKVQQTIISDGTFNLLKYFISSDTALDQLNNKFLGSVLNPDIKVYSVWTFRYKILPQVLKDLKIEIANVLQSSEYITLITDGWTGPFSNIEYWAVCVQTVNSSWETEFIVLGMNEMTKGHTAEEIQIAIENIVNQYDFDNTKIKG